MVGLGRYLQLSSLRRHDISSSVPAREISTCLPLQSIDERGRTFLRFKTLTLPCHCLQWMQRTVSSLLLVSMCSNWTARSVSARALRDDDDHYTKR